MFFSSDKNWKLKVKLWWVRARKRKKRAFFVPFILSEGNFFKTCVSSQCIVHWIHSQNRHFFTYKKNYFIHFRCLFLKSSKAFSVSLILFKFTVSSFWFLWILYLTKVSVMFLQSYIILRFIFRRLPL